MNFKTTVVVVLLALCVGAGCSKPSAAELFAKGNAYFEKDLIPEAIVQYRLAIQADPQRGEMRMKLSEAYLRQRDGTEALREAVMGADLLPTDVAAQLRAGNLLLAAKAFDDAKTRADKALALDPKNVEAMILKGNALALLKDLDGAIAEYQEALALNPSRDQVYANIGAIQYSRGQVKEAEATFRKAMEMAPTSVAARIAFANFLWASSQSREAESVMKEALVLEPANIEANRALGVFYMTTGRAPEAEPYFKTITETTGTADTKIALADYYLMLSRVDDAKAILVPLSQTTSSFAPASLRLAAIEAAQNNRPAAMTMVQAVLARTPKYAPARVMNMRLLLADGKVDEAVTAAAALIKDAPNSSWASEANFLVGNVHVSRDRTEEALKSYAEALRIQPQSLAITLALAQLQLRLGNADKAQTYAQHVLLTRPQDLTARAIVVRTDLLRQDLPKAAAGLASLERDYPNTVPVMKLRAARDLAAGRADSARATYAKVAEMAPDDLEALEGLTILDLRAGRVKEGTDRIEAALKRLPPGSDLLVVAARAYGAAGNLAKTEELLRQAIEREPSRLGAYFLLGQVYVKQNRLSDARDQFEQLVRNNPQSIAANTMLGMILEAQGKTAEAEQQYQKTLNVDTSAPVAANNLAWIYVASNRNLDQALQLAQTAIRGLPEEPHVNDTIGWIYYQKGMHAQAVRHLELSVARDATDATSHYHLGMAYVATGDADKARRALTKALSINSNFDGAQEATKALAALGR